MKAHELHNTFSVREIAVFVQTSNWLYKHLHHSASACGLVLDLDYVTSLLPSNAFATYP